MVMYETLKLSTKHFGGTEKTFPNLSYINLIYHISSSKSNKTFSKKSSTLYKPLPWEPTFPSFLGVMTHILMA